MLDDFLEYIKVNRLVKKGEKVLLAVSGGIDSMVMTDLFTKTGISIGIAHCNFCLRGSESDKDEELVKEFAANHKIPFFIKKFKTKEYAGEKGISIQMAARELRYAWFEEVRKQNGFNKIAVAHNLNDNIETFLINLVRGTGIAGLTGMKISGHRIIRPLLFATREYIEEYCKKNCIIYREDRSNAETKYTRNKIRHLVLPVLKEINPSIENTIKETAERLGSVNNIVNDLTDKLRKGLLKRKKDIISVKISDLKPLLKNKTLLFELFRNFGITGSKLVDVGKLISGKTGDQVFTTKYRFLKNRDEILISKRRDKNIKSFTANTVAGLKEIPGIISVRTQAMSPGQVIPSDPNIACLDFFKVIFPVVVRRWQNGDIFYPLGMKKKKKLSDYFIDRKFSRLDKEKAMILESAGDIVWIIGERIDDRFKVTEETSKLLVIKV